MRTTDGMTNALAQARDLREATRQAVIVACLDYAPAVVRVETARLAWRNGADAMARLQPEVRQAAAVTAAALRERLFDLTGVAPWATPSPTLSATRNASLTVAERLDGPETALEVLRRYLGLYDDASPVFAGAVAGRAYREGWADVVDVYAVSHQGAQRGGRKAITRLTYCEDVAAGRKVPEVIADLEPIETMAGDRWPGAVV